jgi:transcriptional regulator with XRE-family HTH domain
VLAKTAAITQAYLAQIEGAKRIGHVKVYQRLAVALGVDVEDLLPPMDQRPAATRKARSRKR